MTKALRKFFADGGGAAHFTLSYYSPDLDARIKSAVNDWQDAHGLRFIPWSFTEMRNKERVA